jgi:curved DNA-binding protein CbpA
VASLVTFEAWAESLEGLNYYQVLRVQPGATAAEVKAAFHALALRCHPDRYAQEPKEVGHAAAKIFKRASEAYAVLSRPAARKDYDDGLKQGRLRHDPSAKLAEREEEETIAALADTKEGKASGARADHWLRVGDFEKVRVELVTACNHEPYNKKLKAALEQFYAAWAKS